MSELTEKARALAGAATEGPWFAHGLEPPAFPRLDTLEQFPWGSLAWIPTERTGREQAHRDLAFIAEARTLVPALCDENEALQAKITHWKANHDEQLHRKHVVQELHDAQAARIRELEAVLTGLLDMTRLDDHRANDVERAARRLLDNPTDQEEGT